MSMEMAKKQRALVNKALDSNVFEHQIKAAKNAFNGLSSGARAVILAAEMQSGKSGVALSIACLQRLGLNDSDISTMSKLRDSLYVMTMADTELLAQAKNDLKPAQNVVVSNLTRFERDVEKYFVREDPKLIIVDECHYGSGSSAVRYEKLFDYIEKENTDCKVVFISATPLSALLATEGDSIIRRGIKTKLVFHRTSDDYYGIREMLAEGQVRAISGRTKNILNSSPQRDEFIEKLVGHNGAGWALVRVPSGTAMHAKEMLSKHGIPYDNIYIIGRSLNGVPKEELRDIDSFKTAYETAAMFDEKLVAITVAGCRAGINFGYEMKDNIIASWDSTVSNVAAVVQANIGRTCGYHTNKDALHYTNIHAVNAYGKILDYLESNCADQASDDIEGLREEYERICSKYDVRGLDVGARVNKIGGLRTTKKIYETDVFLTDSYIPVPGLLHEAEAKFKPFTEDPKILEGIQAVREAMGSKDGVVEAKSSRSLRGFKWIVASWVNGDTYDNPEKAMAGGTVRDRVLDITLSMDDDQPVTFNDVIPVGGGEKVAEKELAIFVFSIYNVSRRRGVSKKQMSVNDMEDMCQWFKIPYDDTLLLVFKKGELCEERTERRREEAEIAKTASPIIEDNKFQQMV